jgi:hypothetical protein
MGQLMVHMTRIHQSNQHIHIEQSRAHGSSSRKLFTSSRSTGAPWG